MSSKPISVLLIDDDEDDYFIVRNVVRKIKNAPFDLSWCGDIEQARKVIAQSAHDVYLIDYRLGPLTGLELLADVNIADRPEPFIILTGAGDRKIEEEAMRLGVADYLVKGQFNEELLARVIRYSLQRKHMEQQRLQHLQEIARSKDEFIGLASHQLRTPATAVKQYVGMLLEGYAGELSAAQLTFLKQAYTSNERQLKIVDDILRIAQLDMKKIRLHQETYDFKQLLADILSDIEPVLKDKQQKLEVSLPDHGLPCTVDRMYVGMAVSNILDNASKYSHADTVIRIAADVTDGRLVITIRDEGVGIDQSDFDKLFAKFSRIPNPLSVIVGGTGLGLYWSNEIIHLHDGTITVESEVDKGTSFMISLPAGDPAHSDAIS